MSDGLTDSLNCFAMMEHLGRDGWRVALCLTGQGWTFMADRGEHQLSFTHIKSYEAISKVYKSVMMDKHGVLIT